VVYDRFRPFGNDCCGLTVSDLHPPCRCRLIVFGHEQVLRRPLTSFVLSSVAVYPRTCLVANQDALYGHVLPNGDLYL
jgi:hypothetical protein